MKKLIIILLAVIALSSCSSSTKDNVSFSTSSSQIAYERAMSIAQKRFDADSTLATTIVHVKSHDYVISKYDGFVAKYFVEYKSNYMLIVLLILLFGLLIIVIMKN